MFFQSLVSKKVFEEEHNFRKILPSLKDYENKYVIMREGRVEAAEDTEEQAYKKAIQLYGEEAPFYIGFVENLYNWKKAVGE